MYRIIWNYFCICHFGIYGIYIICLYPSDPNGGGNAEPLQGHRNDSHIIQRALNYCSSNRLNTNYTRLYVATPKKDRETQIISAKAMVDYFAIFWLWLL